MSPNVAMSHVKVQCNTGTIIQLRFDRPHNNGNMLVHVYPKVWYCGFGETTVLIYVHVRLHNVFIIYGRNKRKIKKKKVHVNTNIN